MNQIEYHDLEAPVLEVLKHASVGKDAKTGYITAYQILGRLPEGLRARLRAVQGGTEGCDAGNHSKVLASIAQIASRIPGVDIAYLDTRGLHFNVDNCDDIGRDFGLCGLFRLNEVHLSLF